MKKFEFAANCIELDIAGHMFSIPASIDVANKLESFGKEAQKMAADMPETKEGVAKAVFFLRNTIDELLGKGAADKIFADRQESVFDCIDVMMYITQEFGDFQKAKSNAYKSALPANEFEK